MRQPEFDHRPYGITLKQLDICCIMNHNSAIKPSGTFLNGSVRYRNNSEDCIVSPAMSFVNTIMRSSLCVIFMPLTKGNCNSQYMFGAEVAFRHPLIEYERLPNKVLTYYGHNKRKVI